MPNSLDDKINALAAQTEQNSVSPDYVASVFDECAKAIREEQTQRSIDVNNCRQFITSEMEDYHQAVERFDNEIAQLGLDMRQLAEDSAQAIGKVEAAASSLADLYGRTINWEDGVFNSSLAKENNGSYSRAIIDIAGCKRVEFFSALVNRMAYVADADNNVLHTFPAQGAKEYAIDLSSLPQAKFLYLNNYRAGSDGRPLDQCWLKAYPAADLKVAEKQLLQQEALTRIDAEANDLRMQVDSLQDGLGARTEKLEDPPLYEDEQGNKGYYLRLSGGKVYVTQSDYRRFTLPIHLDPGDAVFVKSAFQAGVCPIAIVAGDDEYIACGQDLGGYSYHAANSGIDVAVSFDATSEWEIKVIRAAFSYRFDLESERSRHLNEAVAQSISDKADQWAYCPLFKNALYRVVINNSNRDFIASPEPVEGIDGAFSLKIVGGEQLVAPNSDVFFIKCNASEIQIESIPVADRPKTRNLYIGKLSLGNINANAGIGVVQPSAFAAVMADFCAMPAAGLKCHIRLPDGWKCVGYAAPDNPRDNVAAYRAATPGDQKILQNGDIASFKNDARMYRFVFSKADGSAIDIEQAQLLADNGKIAVLYEADELSVSQRNAHKEALVAATMGRDSMSSNSNVGGADAHGLFTLVHVTDLHGDPVRYDNALQYADAIGADAVAMSGDYCMDLVSDGMDFLARLAAGRRTPIFPCVGNHDTALARSSSMPTCSQAEQVANVIAPFVQLGSVPAGTDKTYYCKDITFKDAPTVSYLYRLIALNTYEGPRWDRPYISKEQIDWLCATLAGTPDKYGVIIIMHNVENTESSSNTPLSTAQGAENFLQARRRNKTAGIPGMPISRIVDAWQSRSAISGSYQNADDAQPTSFSADFSAVPANAEFICFLCGHEHMDLVGYNPGTTNRQAVLGLCCGSGAPTTGSAGVTTGFGRSGDLPRKGLGVTQDAFNVIGIDRQRRRIKITRIGADTNVDFVKRDCAILSYA